MWALDSQVSSLWFAAAIDFAFWFLCSGRRQCRNRAVQQAPGWGHRSSYLSWPSLTLQWQSHQNVSLWSLGSFPWSLSLELKAFDKLCSFLRGRAGPEIGLALACILMNLAWVGSLRGEVVLTTPCRLAMSAAPMPSYFPPLFWFASGLSSKSVTSTLPIPPQQGPSAAQAGLKLTMKPMLALASLQLSVGITAASRCTWLPSTMVPS